jgi:CubicO group peptidase (beta-lactamase class C family)
VITRRRALIPFFLPALLAGIAHAQTLDAATEKKLDEVFAPWDKKDQPGGVVGVFMDGKVVYAKGFGLANMEHNVPMTADSVLDIGSVSKHFTSTCILLLQEEGKVNIDDEVQKYIPELPKFSKPITVRQLMNHTSGIRDYFTLFSIKGWNPLDTLENSRFLSLMSKQEDLNFDPQTSWNYSNTGYALLGEIVRRKSGMTLGAFEKKFIFDPLEMTHTQIHESNTMLVKNRAQSYTKGGGTQYLALNSSLELVGDGGVLTTVGDMAKWDANFSHNKLGKGDKEFFAPMYATAKLLNGSDTHYGAGLFIDKFKGLDRIQHGGDWLAFNAMYSRYPAQKVSIVTFGNDGTQLGKSLNDKAAEVLLAKYIKETPAPVAGELKAIPLEMPQKEAIVGRWTIKDLTSLTIRLEGPALRLQVDGQQPFPLGAASDTHFFIREPRCELFFEKNEDGTITKGRLKQGAADLELIRTLPFVPDDAIKSAVEGRYYSNELEMSYRIENDKDGIKLYQEGQLVDVLTFESEKRLNGSGVFFDVVRDDAGRITAILMQAGRAMNLKFRKV